MWSQAFYFDREDVALHGFHHFFIRKADEEMEHAKLLMYYMNKRGGRIVLTEIGVPDKNAWGSAKEAMQAALDLEKKVNAVSQRIFDSLF